MQLVSYLTLKSQLHTATSCLYTQKKTLKEL